MEPLNIIKGAYKLNFNRELTDQDAKDILDSVFSRMHSDFVAIPDFSEDRFEHYMNGNIELIFSPKIIFFEINKILDNVGEEDFAKSGKYKRAREMEVAARFCIAQKKISGEEWMIKVQDNPDIILAKKNNRSFKDKFWDARKLEVMRIPEIAQVKWGQDFITELINFIKEKKFLKDYGHKTNLIVSLDFNKLGLDLADVSKKIKLLPNNPYNQILISATISDDLTKSIITQIYPTFNRVDIDIETEQGLLY